MNNIKSFFGINSPSKLFKDQIGKNLALGIGLGFSDEMDDVSKAMQDAIPTALDGPGIDVNAGFNTAISNAGAAVSLADIGFKLDGIAAIMTEMFPALVSAFNIKVVLDDGTLVGRLAPEIDKNLGLLQRQRSIVGV